MISHEQYQQRAAILYELLRPYIDDRYGRVMSIQEKEETAILSLALHKPFHDKIATFLRDILHCCVSVGQEHVGGRSTIFVDVSLDTNRFHQTNLLHLPAAVETFVMPKYLILDSDEILRGEIIYPSDEDIILETYDCGSVRVLRKGYQLMQHLIELTGTLGYEMVLYSKHDQKDQELFLAKLQAACMRHGVTFPNVLTMAIGDPGRQVLEDALGITDKNRHHHIMIEENTENLSAAVSEGYQGHLSGNLHPSSFAALLEHVVINARQKRETVAAAITDAPILVPATPVSCRFFPAVISSKDPVPDLAPTNCLTQEQQDAIQAMIVVLEKKIQSCWPYPHKLRKQDKVNALANLINLCATMDVSAAVEKVEKDFPSVRQGKVHALLQNLSNKVALTNNL